MKKNYIVPTIHVADVELEENMLESSLGTGVGHAGDDCDVKSRLPKENEVEYGNLW